MSKQVTPKEREKLVDALLSLAEIHIAPSERFLAFSPRGLSEELRERLLSEWKVRSGVLKLLLNQKRWSERFSEKHLDSRINQIVERIRGSSEKRESALADLEELVLEHEGYQQTQTIYVPLDGIRLHVQRFALGQVELVLLTPDQVNAFKQKTLKAFGPTPPGEVQSLIERMTSDIDRMGRSVNARFVVVAEPVRAGERAKDEVRRALDLIRFAIPALHSKSEKVRIGFMGEVATSRTVMAFEYENPEQSQLSIEKTGPLSAFHVRDETIGTMEELGVLTLSALLKEPYDKLNDFKKSLLMAVHWFAAAQSHDDDENEVLNLVTSLEAFFKQQQGVSIAEQLTTCVAFSICKDAETRLRLKGKLRDIYGLRSAISHGGKIGVPQADVDYLKDMVFGFLQTMIKFVDVFSSRDHLSAEIERLKMSGTMLGDVPLR